MNENNEKSQKTTIIRIMYALITLFHLLENKRNAMKSERYIYYYSVNLLK